MKKLVALILVLGMASLANAGILMSVDKTSANLGEVVTVTVGWDGTGASDFLGYVDAFGAGMDSAVLGANAGDFPAAIEGPYATTDLLGVLGDGVEVKLTQAWAVGSAPQTGPAFVITLTKGAADINLQLWDDNLGYVDPAATAIVTPEPATLAILGLGALLLRRK